MNIHRNARTTPYSRAEIVRRVMTLHETPSAVATALGVSCRTVAKWLARYQAEGEAGLTGHSSRPLRMPRATSPDVMEQIIAARRHRLCGKQSAQMLGLSPATAAVSCTRQGSAAHATSIHPNTPRDLAPFENRLPFSVVAKEIYESHE